MKARIDQFLFSLFLPVLGQWPGHMSGSNVKQVHLGLGEDRRPSRAEHLLSAQLSFSSSEGLATPLETLGLTP